MGRPLADGVRLGLRGEDIKAENLFTVFIFVGTDGGTGTIGVDFFISPETGPEQGFPIRVFKALAIGILFAA